jgi:hemerythrin
MNGFTPWEAQRASSASVIDAQHIWLSRLAETLGDHLHNSIQAVGECLELLVSGLLQSVVSVEEACLEQGFAARERLIARHNELCLAIANLLQRHTRAEPVGPELQQCLEDWLKQDPA